MQDGRAWPNFKSDYLPMVDAAAASGAKIIAANAPRRYVSLVGRHGLSALPGSHASMFASHPAASSSAAQHASSPTASSLHRIEESRGLPTAPDALAPPSAALMSKIHREMMAAQQAVKADVPVCGTPAPESGSEQPQNQASTSAVSNLNVATSIPGASADASSTASSSDMKPAKAASSSPASSGAIDGGSARLAPDTSNKTNRQQEKECPYSGMRLSDNFFAAQALWDATMADSILCALQNSSSSSSIRAKHTCPGTTHLGSTSTGTGESPLVMHVCGKFHMEEGLGICEHLRRRRPEVSFGTVAITPVDLPQLRQHMEGTGGLEHGNANGEIPGLPCSLQELKKMADFVVLTDGTTERCF